MSTTSPYWIAHYTLVKGDGTVYSLRVNISADRWSSTEVIPCGRLPTDVCSMVSLEVEKHTMILTFAGSLTAQSILGGMRSESNNGLQEMVVMDTVIGQNSPHSCHFVRKDSTKSILLAHGYKRLMNLPDRSNYITEVYQRLPIRRNQELVIPTLNKNNDTNVLATLHLNSADPTHHSHLVMSNKYSTTVYEFKGKEIRLLSRELSAFNLGVSTLGVVEMKGTYWGYNGMVCVQVWDRAFQVIGEGKEVLMTVTEKTWDLLKTTSLHDMACVDEKLLLQTMDEIYLVIPGKEIQFQKVPTLNVSDCDKMTIMD